MRSWLACLVALAAGCYDPPKPECGFVCGPQGACPTGYTCQTRDNRCHRDGTDGPCESVLDGSVDGSGDTTSPTVVDRTPDDGATGVAVDASVGAFFDEDVSGVAESSFFVQQSGTVLLGTVTYDGVSRGARLDPLDQLAPNTVYTVVLTPAITDYSGNAIVAESWSFTTGSDLVAPHVRTTQPASGSSNVAVSAPIIITFDEPVQNVTATTYTVDHGGTPITGTLAASNGGRTYTFTPSAALPAATAITVTLTTGITDLAGNPLPAGAGFQFTTA